MYYYCPEHPEVDNALKFGQSGKVGKPEPRCFECGAVLTSDIAFVWEVTANSIVSDELICETCFDDIVSDLPKTELAELIGAKMVRAKDFYL